MGDINKIINMAPIIVPNNSAITYFSQGNLHENKLLAYDQDLLLLLRMNGRTTTFFL